MARKAGSEDGDLPPVDHNQPLTKEEKGALYTVHLRTAREDAKFEEIAKLALKEVQKRKKKNRHLVSADGFSLALMDEGLKQEAQARYEVEDYEDLRSFQREIHGLPVGAQPELPFNDSFQMEQRERAHWVGAGFIAGERGDDIDPPEECPQEFSNDYKESWHKGQASFIMAQQIVERLSSRSVN